MKRFFLFAVGSLLFLLVGGFAVCIFFGEALARELAMATQTAQKKAEFQTWRTQKVPLPPEALSLTPFSAETMALGTRLARFYDANETATKRITSESNRIGSPEFQYPDEELEALAEFMRLFEQIVDRDDYQITAIADHDEQRRDGFYSPKFMVPSIAWRISRLQQHKLLSEGNPNEAWDRTNLIFRSGRAEDFSMAIAHLMNLAAISIGSSAAARFPAECDDPGVLRKGLEDLSLARSDAEVFRKDIDLWTLDKVGEARIYGHYGIQPRLADRTRAQLSQEWIRLGIELREPRVWSDYRRDPAANEDRLRRLLEEKQRLNEPHYVSRLKAPRFAFAEAFIFLIDDGIDPIEVFRREKATIAKLDAVRADFARKLCEIENGKPMGDPAMLIPEFLPELPKDPFDAKADLRFASGRFYSIGPDGADDAAAIIYDPTNGSMSRGDIFHSDN